MVSVSRKAHRVGCALRDGAGGKRVEQIFRKLGQVGDIDAAVAAVALPELLGFEVLAERRGDHLAGEQLLDELRRRGAAEDAAAERGVRVLAVDARDALAQRGELFLDILHLRFFFAQYSISSAGRIQLVYSDR